MTKASIFATIKNFMLTHEEFKLKEEKDIELKMSLSKPVMKNGKAVVEFALKEFNIESVDRLNFSTLNDLVSFIFSKYVDFTGARYGFIQDELPDNAKVQDQEAAVRNLTCFHHVLEECGEKISPIYKVEITGHPGLKAIFFDVGTEKKNQGGDRVFYSFGNKVMRRGFSIQFNGLRKSEMAKVGLSFEQALREFIG